MKRRWSLPPLANDLVERGRARLLRSASRARWRALSFFAAVLLGDRDWGAIRLWLAFAVVVLFLLFGRVTEAISPRLWVEQVTASALPGTQPVIRTLGGFLDTMLTRQALRHALPPIAGFVLAILVAASFVNDLFELSDLRLSYDYLFASLFGLGYPRLFLRDGNGGPAEAANPLLKIGGPGRVGLGTGLAAVFEQVAGPSSVFGAGWHFVRRFETLREVFDLRDQFRTVPEIKAMSKDGIPVTVKDVQMSFRLRTGSNRIRTEADPFPFSVSALRRAAYNKTVGSSGPAPWADSVAGAIAGQIRSMIAQRRLDNLIAARDGDPRAEMLAEFSTSKTRQKYADMGAEVLWVSLGHFETPAEVSAQRIRTWQADWQRLAKVTEAEGQAERVRLEEQMRGEEVTDLLNAIENGIQPRLDAQMSASDVFYLQMAETLEAYASRQVALSGQVQPDLARLARRLRQIGGSSNLLPLTNLDELMLY